MKVKLDEGAHIPTVAHAADAGYDLYSREEKIIPPYDSVVFDTGVHIEIPLGYCGELKSKSGLNINYDLTSTGLIDSGYSGSIRVKLYNHGRTRYMVHQGDKISQIIISPCTKFPLEVVDELTETERGNGGFGSTGR